MWKTTNIFLQLECLCFRAYVSSGSDFTIDRPLGTLHVNHCVCGIFPRNGEIVPWQSHLVGILPTQQLCSPTTSQKSALTSKKDPTDYDKNSPISICTAQKVFLDWHTQYPVLVDMSPSSTHTVKLRQPEKNNELAPAAYSVIIKLSFDWYSVSCYPAFLQKRCTYPLSWR